MMHAAEESLLLLFDIDGTLLRSGGAREHAAALVQALCDVYEVALPDDAVQQVGPWGKTDQQIAREVLRAADLDDRVIDAGRDRWLERCWEIFCDADLARLAAGAMPGAEAALRWGVDAGHQVALLTGNIEPIAHRKVEAAGLGSWFRRGQGAFGSDAEDRRELVPVARQRAGGWAAEHTVVIGDAPGDVACALAGGAMAVGLLGHFGAAELAGAHALIGDLADLGEALADCRPPSRGTGK
jgi:phosphoglycolate phosphatase-like HAD superfamily hydrolase